MKSGTGLISTSMFIMVSMFAAFCIGVLTGEVTFGHSTIASAYLYAGLSSVTAMLYLVGSVNFVRNNL